MRYSDTAPHPCRHRALAFEKPLERISRVGEAATRGCHADHHLKTLTHVLRMKVEKDQIFTQKIRQRHRCSTIGKVGIGGDYNRRRCANSRSFEGKMPR